MVKGKKETKEKTKNSSDICILCRRVVRNCYKLCVYCTNRIEKIQGPKGDDF